MLLFWMWDFGLGFVGGCVWDGLWDFMLFMIFSVNIFGDLIVVVN